MTNLPGSLFSYENMAVIFFLVMNLFKIEVFTGYETATDGSRRTFIRQPKWELLTKNIGSTYAGKRVLCRFKRYEGGALNAAQALLAGLPPTVAGDLGARLTKLPFNNDLLDLPLYNEYFITNIPSDVPSQTPAPAGAASGEGRGGESAVQNSARRDRRVPPEFIDDSGGDDPETQEDTTTTTAVTGVKGGYDI